MNIGSAIKSIRKEKKMGQKELAEKSDLSVNALSQIETNVSFPHKQTILNIAEALEVPVSYLLYFSLSADDVPEDKREVFNHLNSAIKAILIEGMQDKPEGSGSIQPGQPGTEAPEK